MKSEGALITYGSIAVTTNQLTNGCRQKSQKKADFRYTHHTTVKTKHKPRKPPTEQTTYSTTHNTSPRSILQALKYKMQQITYNYYVYTNNTINKTLLCREEASYFKLNPQIMSNFTSVINNPSILNQMPNIHKILYKPVTGHRQNIECFKFRKSLITTWRTALT